MSTEPVGFRCGVDTGGTFTDGVAIADDGTVVTAKALSTPPNFAGGFFAALDRLAGQLGLSTGELLAKSSRLVHGTTVATNVLVERRGATVGLIATRGHRDALFVMRGSGRVMGLRPEQVLDGALARKPEPVVTKAHAVEVVERVDARGQVLLGLDEDHARETIRGLVKAGVEAIAVALLWGFRNPVHERRLAELIAEVAPGLPCSLAHELAPRTGEYERTVTAVLDAYVKPATVGYLTEIDRRCRELGHGRPLLIMQCDGTVAPVDRVVRAPILTVQSGPAAGLEAARMMGVERGHDRIVVFDMGGTTSDIGLVVDGVARRRTTSVHDQYEFFMPSVEISSTGIGGGSIASVSTFDGGLRVGPMSAGALPGPACYGRGGTDATVTDADVVLGRLGPSVVLGQDMKLDGGRASDAVGTVAQQLEIELRATAAGISRLAELQVAQEIRKLTISRGYDPREFVLYAYGGAGPLHASAVAAQLGIETVVVPLADGASLWSAFGAACCELGGTYERSVGMLEPFDIKLLDRELAGLEARARNEIRDTVTDPDGVTVRFAAGLRYRAQVHEVWVDCPAPPLDEPRIERLIASFEQEYETLFGRGTGYRAAGIELAAVRCLISERTPGFGAVHVAKDGGRDAEEPHTRRIWWAQTGDARPSAVIPGVRRPGESVAGPAVLELEDTSVLIPPGAVATVDTAGNLVLSLNGAHAAPSSPVRALVS